MICIMETHTHTLRGRCTSLTGQSLFSGKVLLEVSLGMPSLFSILGLSSPCHQFLCLWPIPPLGSLPRWHSSKSFSPQARTPLEVSSSKLLEWS